MSTVAIHSLAPEIIGRILELADLRHREYETAPDDLISASLMCKIWSMEARFLLWRSVYIWREQQVLPFLASPGLGKYRTTSLYLYGRPLIASSVMDIVKVVAGVERVFLRNFWSEGDSSLDISVLYLPALHGTHIQAVFLLRSSSQADYKSFCFRYIGLRFLTLRDVDLSNPLHLPPTQTLALHRLELGGPIYPPRVILSTFFSPALQHLVLHSMPESDDDFQAAALLPVASQLRIIELWELPYPSWHLLFVNCVDLNHLKFNISFNPDRVLLLDKSFSPNQIEILTINGRNFLRWYEGFVKLLDSPNLGRLTRICSASTKLCQILEQEGGEEVLRSWEEKGVILDLN